MATTKAPTTAELHTMLRERSRASLSRLQEALISVQKVTQELIEEAGPDARGTPAVELISRVGQTVPTWMREIEAQDPTLSTNPEYNPNA